MKDRERRFKMMQLSPSILLHLVINPQRLEDGTIQVRTLEGVPPDVTIDGVRFDDYRQCWELRLWHPSFPVIENCSLIPDVVVTVSVQNAFYPMCGECPHHVGLHLRKALAQFIQGVAAQSKLDRLVAGEQQRDAERQSLEKLRQAQKEIDELRRRLPSDQPAAART